MLPTQNGAMRLFRFAGINVFVHWSWFLVAVFEINTRGRNYSSPIWNAAEYLCLFAIVLMHEFGHALACRQVGGEAHQIILWPLGGVAYVAPPPRPGAQLWSIAAGPLVNVALVPVFYVLKMVVAAAIQSGGPVGVMPDLYHLVSAVAFINIAILIFNMLPVYPLDGGQILQSLLWFWIGRARSLTVTSVIGFIAGVGLIGFAILQQSIWIGIIAAFILSRCVAGFKNARFLAEALKAPRHEGFACPACKEAPRVGAFWRCDQCGTPFDTFATRATCPACKALFPTTSCPDCHRVNAMADWVAAGGGRR